MGAGLLLLAAPAAAGSLEPHRAAYSLSLAGPPQGGPFVEVTGGLALEWQRTCEGWISRQRLKFAAANQGFGEEPGPFSHDPGITTHDVRFSSFEATDGSQLHYAVRSFEGERVEEEYRGEARIEGDEGGTARFTKPEAREIALPPGTVFPTEHMRQVIASARAGERMVSHEVFDGWGFDSLTQITSAIGAPTHLKIATGGHGPETELAWPVSMAYYNIERGEDVPSFEATFMLTESGLLRELELDYGDFALSAELEALERLDPPEC